MAIFKDKGIIIKQRNFGEADRILTIITNYHGRIEAIAKGIKKPTSRKGGNVSLLCHTKFSFAQGKNLDIITEAELIDDFDYLKSNLENINNIFYILEITEKTSQEKEEVAKIYLNLLSLLKTLSKKNYNRLSILAYILQLINLTGHCPDLTLCPACNTKLTENQKNFVNKYQTGFYDGCIKNRDSEGSNFIQISNRIIKSIRFLINNPLDKSGLLVVSPGELEKLEGLINNWIQGIIGSRIYTISN